MRALIFSRELCRVFNFFKTRKAVVVKPKTIVLWKTMPGRVKQVPQDSTE